MSRPDADAASPPQTVICLYRVRGGREDEFSALLARHWPTLRELGLATPELPRHYRGAEQTGEPLFVEIFEWSSADAPGVAHEHPDVMAIWEAMDELTEARQGRPNMEFPHVRAIDVVAGA